ncbi:MAG: glucose-6-phosphate isomerase [Tannerellaceae bacterium]|jgi:glucose-6-phosphate isomerase|nr:glucose-6-phosphate isomerase [Tannerellaceae bacterium]
MNSITLHLPDSLGIQTPKGRLPREAELQKSIETLHNATGAGNDFLGWLHLPSSLSRETLADIEQTADRLRNRCEVVVVVGIGGSYLGAKAVLEALTPSFAFLDAEGNAPLMLYAGHHLSQDYLSELCRALTGRSFGLIHISKSGTTTEPALAFRILRKQLEEAVGREEARERIVAVTDARRGALKTLAQQEGYKTFVIPDDVGGRFSVFTPAGLLPIATGGVSVDDLIKGAAEMERLTGIDLPVAENIAVCYAAARNELYAQGKKIEILANFHPKLHYIGEWWKQLFGESEGKEHKGIFPAAVDLTTDLHSLGQWIQEGERILFETFLSVETPSHHLLTPADPENLDGLNFLAGKPVDEINKMAEWGTRLAHSDGGVPNLRIVIPELTPRYLGQLLYFFEKACAVSGYLLGVNPFDQPGVEAYKKNMFALLDKPGYEKESLAIRARIR